MYEMKIVILGPAVESSGVVGGVETELGPEAGQIGAETRSGVSI